MPLRLQPIGRVLQSHERQIQTRDPEGWSVSGRLLAIGKQLCEDEVNQMNMRLAMRQEGMWWNAYLAERDSMNNAIHLGSIRMALVENQDVKNAFLDAMKVALTAVAKDLTGLRLTWPNPPEPASESERSGHA